MVFGLGGVTPYLYRNLCNSERQRDLGVVQNRNEWLVDWNGNELWSSLLGR